jgi:hypothetical protein
VSWFSMERMGDFRASKSCSEREISLKTFVNFWDCRARQITTVPLMVPLDGTVVRPQGYRRW